MNFERIAASLRRSSPRPGDIVSLKAINSTGVYWLASVGRTSSDGTAIRVLSVRDRRPRRFRRDELEPHDDPIVLTPKQLREAEPRLVHRGPNEFWDPDANAL